MNDLRIMGIYNYVIKNDLNCTRMKCNLLTLAALCIKTKNVFLLYLNTNYLFITKLPDVGCFLSASAKNCAELICICEYFPFPT